MHRDLVTLEETGVARILDLDALHHLTHDDFDVLVIDAHALEAVDLLDLVHQVLLHLGRPKDVQDVLGADGAFAEGLAGLDEFAFMDQNVLAVGYLVAELLVFRRDDFDLAVAALQLAQLHRAVHLADHRRVLGSARFEELGHTGQTAGDVLGLQRFPGDLDQRVTRPDLLPLLNHQVTARGQDVVAHLLAILVDDDDARVQLALAGNLDDHALLHARDVVRLFAHGQARLDVRELHRARFRGQDAGHVGIPLEEHVALLDLLLVAAQERGAVGNGVLGDDAVLVIQQLDDAVPANGNQAFPVDGALLFGPHLLGNGVDVIEQDHAIALRLDLGFRRDQGRRTTHVEGTQCKLGAGLADGLGRDDPHRLAGTHLHAVGQVDAVALGADTDLCFAGEHRTDAHLVDPAAGDELGLFVADEDVPVQHLLATDRVDNLFRRIPSQDALEELLGDLLALLLGLHRDTTDGVAVLFGDDHVLGHIHQAAGEVAGVRRLQRGVRQPLPGAVGTDEVLQDGKALLEVRRDRRLDDLALATGHGLLGLGHQATHPRELPDLVLGTTGAGVGHHVDRVEAVTVFLNVTEHLLGHLAGGVRPEVDHLVVTLTIGDDAVLVT